MNLIIRENGMTKKFFLIRRKIPNLNDDSIGSISLEIGGLLDFL